MKKTVIEHLGQLDFLRGIRNVILLGPPGPANHTSPRLSGSAPASPVNAQTHANVLAIAAPVEALTREAALNVPVS